MAPPGGRMRPTRSASWAAVALGAAIAITFALLAVDWPPPFEVLVVGAMSIALDCLAIGVLLRSATGRSRAAVTAYAAVRTLIAAVWFTMLATLPAYAAAVLLLAWPPARRARVGPATSPHDFRAVADDWSGTAGPFDRAAQLGTRSCAVCGRPPDDLLHAPPEPGA